MEFHRNLFEIKLEHGMGYGYAVTALSRSLNHPKVPFQHLAAYPLNIRNKSPLKKKGLAQFEAAKFLMHPVLMWSRPRLRGEGRWKPIGFLESIDLESKIPDFALPSPHIDEAGHPDKVIKWCVVEYFYVNDSYTNIVSYEQARHLGYWKHTDYATIASMMTMEWMKVEGLDILDFYDISDRRSRDWLPYHLTAHLPKYSEVPEEMWLKAKK